ncbi:MAG: 50S ribosomal protein L11 methyltransferase [Bacteroidales bacterium]|nr:50S ribosomal protein L11 methyltransferase [Bacteroidales bacterium]
MKYLEFTFTTSPANEAISDILSMVLAEIGFESFIHTDELDLPRVGSVENFPEAPIFADKADEDTYLAYIQTSLFDQAALDACLENFPLPDVTITYEQKEAEDKDWNEEWEKNYFQPIIIPGQERPRCTIAATFHKDVPNGDYNVRINPQMSFGTGHHQTTAQMIGRILDDDMEGLEVLDMGCGTSILAILARMRGAKHCVAVDFDEWCVKNSIENIAINGLDGIDVYHGDASALAPFTSEEGFFDLVIANINRNILLADLEHYVRTMKAGAHIYMSGFYTEDVPMLRAHAESLGLTFVDERSLDNWACIKLKK